MANSGERFVRLARQQRALDFGDRLVPLYSGALHYWRIAPDKWETCLAQIRSLGLPIVETYVPWSVHEMEPGRYDFGEQSEEKNLGRFIDLAASMELVVFVRPGPHINAEMTWFGLPKRIVFDPECQARSPQGRPVVLPFPPTMFPVPSYASLRFRGEVARWYEAVAEVLRPRLYPDGPVALIQVDNEASYYFRNGPYDQDYHSDAVSKWSDFLQTRHKTLEAASERHSVPYERWDEIVPPKRLSAERPEELPLHLDWAAFHEALLDDALTEMRDQLGSYGLTSIPTVHNVALGEGGQPINLSSLNDSVDIWGLDYYHSRRELETVKRRTLLLSGSTDLPFAPELGVGAPPWFTPLSHEDSFQTALCALAYGLRGFNLYMAVDRDRWYGAPVDADGTPRVEAGAWKHLVSKLNLLQFHELERRTQVALMIPAEYARLSRVAHLLGPISPAVLEATGGRPFDSVDQGTLGFEESIQLEWWPLLETFANALTAAQVPYVYVPSDIPVARLRDYRLVLSPSYEFVSKQRWQTLRQLDESGTTVLYGPKVPELDEYMRPHTFDRFAGGALALGRPAAEVTEEFTERLGIERPFPASGNQVETCVHEDQSGPRVLFVVNWSADSTETEIKVPAPCMLEDALTGDHFRADHALHIAVPPRSVRMLQLTLRSQPGAILNRRGARARRKSA